MEKSIHGNCATIWMFLFVYGFIYSRAYYGGYRGDSEISSSLRKLLSFPTPEGFSPFFDL